MTKVPLVLLAMLAVGLLQLWPGAPPAPPAGTAQRNYTLPFYADNGFTPLWSPPAHRVGPFRLTDQHGQAVTQADLSGRVSVVHFFFASCGSLCPTLVHNLQAVEAARPQAQILSMSVDPASDTVDRLAEYSACHGLGPNWHLLTGEKSVIYGLAKGSLFCADDLVQKPEQPEFLHTEKVFLVDRSGRLRGLYNGSLRLEMERLVGDIGRLL